MNSSEYLSDDDFNQLIRKLENMPHTRPYWKNTRYKYIIAAKIYFLYEIDDSNMYVFILAAKFNNSRKTFNFAKPKLQMKPKNGLVEQKRKYQ
jgi:hypothetical protein